MGVCFAQKQGAERIDSLRIVLEKVKHDTDRVKILSEISNTYSNVNPEEGIIIGKKALEIAKKSFNKSGEASVYRSISANYTNLSDYANAFHYDSLALLIYKSIKDSIGLAKTIGSLAIIYSDQSNQRKAIELYEISLGIHKRAKNKEFVGITYANMANSYADLAQYSKALECYYAALKIGEEMNDKMRIAIQYSGIALVHLDQKNFEKALHFNLKALEYYKKIKFDRGLAAAYNNIGNTYSAQKKYSKSIEYMQKALEINRKLGRKRGIALNLGNIGLAYQKLIDSTEDQSIDKNKIEVLINTFDNALKYLTESRDVCNEIDFKYGLQLSIGNLGGTYEKIASSPYPEIIRHYLKGNKKLGLIKAKELTKQAIAIQEEIGDIENQKLYYENLAIISNGLEEYKEAYQYLLKYNLLKDSLNNKEEKKKSIETELKYEYLKKEAEAKSIQEKKDLILKAEMRKKILQRNYFIAGFFIVVVFAIFVYRSYKNKKKANIQISLQRDIIVEKNKEITDSINYAVAIQNAKLPRRSYILENLPNSLILFKPKDIVSGDFYFFYKKGNEKFIAAVDCTGHGIPGAFMSMIGSEKLYECIMHSSDLSEVLSNMNKGIKASLRQNDSSSEIHDGMDMAICKIVEVDDVTTELYYAGANRPLLLFNNAKELIEIKATKKAIGGFTDDDQVFDAHHFTLQKGDTFYIFTDGYADSFNDQRKKLTSKGFKNLLSSIQNFNMKDQEQYLEKFHKDYIRNTEQIDDILVIGVRI
jgi:serine phosphatase RsbU (regulator of sigma subunit)